MQGENEEASQAATYLLMKVLGSLVMSEPALSMETLIAQQIPKFFFFEMTGGSSTMVEKMDHHPFPVQVLCASDLEQRDYFPIFKKLASRVLCVVVVYYSFDNIRLLVIFFFKS